MVITHFFCCPLLLLLLLLHSQFDVSRGEVAAMGKRPKGNNPLLYEPAHEPILHLDADSFEDTVLNPTRDRAFLVEFYKDWCGYCRRFAPFFKVLSESVRSWPFVQVAAINCADAYNVKICRANDIPTVPKLKYFPRSARSLADGQVIEHSYDSAMEMRERLHQKIMEEFHSEMDKGHASYYLSNGMAYERKCKYASLCKPISAGFAVTGDYASAFSYDSEDGRQHDPWAGAANSTEFLVTVFERKIDLGLPLSLELLLFKPHLEVRRVLVSGPNDVQMVAPSELPYLVVLRRARAHPVMAEGVNEKTLPSLRAMLSPMMVELNKTEQAEAHTKKPIQVVDCASHPDKCRQMFYVSETDMLKAIHSALLDEVISSGGDQVDDGRFVALQNFLDLLIKRFPRTTFERAPQFSISPHPKGVALSSVGKPLSRSQRAVEVFGRLRRVLDSRAAQGKISMDEWKTEFDAAKADNGEPFPVAAEWEHCKGSRPIFRGFTCGLWTAFHAMTVQAYLGQEESPLAPLKAIQDWVSNFFSCSGCRKHFMAMTTEKFPMDANNVKKPEDVVLYLWRAHNIVNKRLHGDETTEDPQYPKEQFPAQFLCPDCAQSAEGPDQDRALRFLLQFSANIKPSP